MSEAELIQEEASDPRHDGFLFNVNLIFVSSFLVNVLMFVIAVVVARVLGPGGKGITALYQTGVNGAYAFISFGVAVGALYYVSRREVTPRQAMESGLTATVGAALLSAAGAAAIGLAFGPELRAADVPYWMVAIAIPLVVQFRLVETLCRCQGRFLAVSVMEVSIPAVILFAFLALDAAGGLSVSRAIVIWSLSPLPATVFGYWIVGLEGMPRGFGRAAVNARIMRFGLQGQAGNIVQLLNYRLDSYLVLLFISAEAVGLYSVGTALSEGLWLVANSIAVVLIPKLAGADAEYASRTAALICRNTLLLTALGAAALGIAAPVAVPLLFGQRFHGAIAPLLWLLPGVVALSGTKVLSAYVFSQGKPLINTWVAMVTLAITVGGDLVLIPLLKVPGAAIASTLAYGVSFTLTMIAFRRISGRPIAEAMVPRRADAALFVEGGRTAVARLRRLTGRSARAAAGSGS